MTASGFQTREYLETPQIYILIKVADQRFVDICFNDFKVVLDKDHLQYSPIL